MRSYLNGLLRIVLGVGFCLSPLFGHGEGNPAGSTTIRRISLLAGSALELEISASGPVKPRAQVIQGPDRLILDFPGAVPGSGLHTLAINRGDVVDARVGLFSSNPPVTRVVLDLKSAQPYQLFPSGNSVVVKFGASGTGPGNSASANSGSSNSGSSNSGSTQSGVVPPLAASDPSADDSEQTVVTIERGPIDTSRKPVEQARVTAPAAASIYVPAAVPVPAPRVEVRFEKGLLSIRCNKANLSEVLTEVRRRTGAEIAIPPGAESEQVFTSLGPAAPKEVLAALLNGSRFNFIVMGSERDPGGLRRVVLTPKEGGAAQAVVYPCGTSQPAMAQVAPDPQPAVQAFGTPMPPEQTEDQQGPPPPPSQQ